MYTLKGFVRIKDLTNNSFGVTSLLGEMSTQSMTFSKERGEYEETTAPNLTLITLSSKDSTSGTVTVSPIYAQHVLSVANTAYNFSKNSTNNSLSVNDILNNLMMAFPGVIADVEAGPMVSTPTLKLPEYISWTNTQIGGNKLKIWFSDAALQKQYDEYEVYIVPPVVNLDDLFREIAVAGAAIDEKTASSVMEEIRTLKGNHPETVIRAETFTFTNPITTSFKRNITWYAVVYGPAGDNTDVIRNEIIAHCLNNSSFDTARWKAIVPDLFRRTEFTLFPRWDRFAIPNRTTQAGIYSPINTLNGLTNAIKAALPTMLPTHIDNQLQIFTHYYKSLSIMSIGGEDNKDSLFKISDYYPDFTIFGTSSTDFGRMAKKTQQFSTMLQELLMVADNINEYVTLPPDVRKMVRGNNLFVAKIYDGVQYLVCVKPSNI